MTLDELASALQQLRTQGLPGDHPIRVESRGSLLSHEEAVIKEVAVYEGEEVNGSPLTRVVIEIVDAITAEREEDDDEG